MKIRHALFALSLTTLIGCSFLDDSPITDQVIDGKTTLYGIGLPCATADQTCRTILTFPGIPWSWCGCTDYLKIGFGRPQKLVQIGLRPADESAPWKVVETTWPSQQRLDNLLPGRPQAQDLARDIEISLMNLPQPDLPAFRKRSLADRIFFVWQHRQDALFLDVEAALQAEGL